MNGQFAISKILLANSGVTELVSDRIYWDEAPQGKTMPYIIIEESDIIPFDTKSGKSTTDHDIIHVYGYHSSKSALRTLMTAVRNGLDGISGTFNDVVVVKVRFQGQHGFTEDIVNKQIYVRDQEYIVRLKL